MSKRQYKRYSREFKLEAIRLADESDKPVAQVARELGLRVNDVGLVPQVSVQHPVFLYVRSVSVAAAHASTG